jgi:hypothetical protein
MGSELDAVTFATPQGQQIPGGWVWTLGSAPADVAPLLELVSLKSVGGAARSRGFACGGILAACHGAGGA